MSYGKIAFDDEQSRDTFREAKLSDQAEEFLRFLMHTPDTTHRGRKSRWTRQQSRELLSELLAAKNSGKKNLPIKKG